MKQEGKHQFLRDLSRNTARGQITNATRGYLCGQAAPYGYDRMLVDDTGAHRQRVKNGEAVAKPRSWHVTLAVSDDPEKVATLKWLFEQYATMEIGLRRLAETLNERGVSGPTGGCWYMGTIREILRNEAYIGRFVWAKRRMGKYHRVEADEIKVRTDGSGVRHNPVEQRIIRDDNHEPLVDAVTFQAVQEKLQSRKHATGHRERSADVYLLSGIVYCGHCGRKMYGSTKTRRKNGKVYQYAQYVCSTYQTAGKKQGCGCHAVDQGTLLDFLVVKLKTEVLAGGKRDLLRDEILSAMKESADSGPERVESLRAKLSKLDKELDLAKRRFLKAPDDVADMLGEELSSMRKQRDRVAAELAATESIADHGQLEQMADAAVDRLWSIAEEFDTAPAPRMRQLLSEMVERVDLYFDSIPKGKRVECPLSKGVATLRRDSQIFGVDNRGDRI